MTPRFLLPLAAACLLAQDPAPPLRVAVTLVQVDAVVLDRAGRQATNLARDDFQLFEDGKPRAISHFSYVRAGAPAATAAATPRSTPSPPAGPLQREDVRRTFAFVIDDLTMSFAGVNGARQAVRKFIDNQIEPGDLAAVVPTSGGAGALQQFTADRKLLLAALDRIRFNLAGMGYGGAVRAIGGNSDDNDSGILALHRQRRFAVGAMGALRFVVDGMKDMPGRKAVVFLSDGVAINKGGKDDPFLSLNQLRTVTDRANRSAAVIYSMDMRGLVYTGLQAQDDVSNLEQEEVTQALRDRGQSLRDHQAGLRFLASETGGRALVNDNDFDGGLARMVEEASGYYLLGFQVEESAAARIARQGKYRRLAVRVNRPGLEVRTRRSYLGDGGAPAAPRSTAERLLAALNSPFAGAGVRLQFTPVFFFDDRNRPAIQALLHINGADLAFSPPDPAGLHTAEIRLVALTEGDTPTPGASTERAYTVRVKQAALHQIRAGGLVYQLQHPVKKPGAYHMRVAVLDQASGRVGSASRFVQIPDIARGGPALSGITLCEGDWRAALQSPLQDRESAPTCATRVFHRGQPLSFGVTLYNVRLDDSTRQPAIELRARLFRDNQLVWEGAPFPAVFKPGMDPRRLPAGGVFTLGEKSLPGPYLLELRATELTGKRATLSEWTEFELR